LFGDLCGTAFGRPGDAGLFFRERGPHRVLSGLLALRRQTPRGRGRRDPRLSEAGRRGRGDDLSALPLFDQPRRKGGRLHRSGRQDPFRQEHPLVPDGMTPSVTYFSFDLETRNSRTILGNSDIGSRSTLVKGDDYLYSSHVPDKDVGSISAGELYRIPVAGGAPEKLPLE